METILKELIEQDFTISQIAEKLNKSASAVSRLLKKFNLKTKRHINHNLNITTKFCRYCNIIKNIQDFPIAKIIGDKVYKRSKCNICYMAMKTKRRQKNALFVKNLKKDFKCEICSINDFRVLDFHHKDDSNKEFNIGDVSRLGLGKEKIIAEIAKCKVLCANCHRILHYKE